MKNIAIVSNELNDKPYALTLEVIKYLIDIDCNCYLDDQIAAVAGNDCYKLTDVTLSHCDFILVIGGDGTMLNAIATYARFNIPFLGVNLGRVGFLADFSQEHYRENLLDVIADRYVLEERMMVQLMSGRKSYGNALNEVIFRHNQGSGVGEFKIFIDDTILTHYTGTGLIAAPQGPQPIHFLQVGRL
jgi:NAD+ kinase